ncbi:SCO2322 family protein [Streptomyces sioyaensis]|uniref:SCO2322 family protein n=1 Tax=Streptomyces sioyaensis TaxID=67364 RepID=UPI003D72A4BB
MRRAALAGAALLAGTVTGMAAGPAQAQEYRYWSVWEGKGSSWTYATEGPGTLRPADGAVTGFRFTVGADSAAAGKPRTAPGFDAICRATPAKEGRKRVGVVVDFGTATDAPGDERPPASRTACAQVSEDASAGEALAAVARPLRYDASALLCAVAGYPKAGCAERVNDSKGAGSAASPAPGAAADGGDDGGPSTGLFGGIAVLVVLGAAAGWQLRRRRG